MNNEKEMFFVKEAPFSVRKDKNLSTAHGEFTLLGYQLDSDGNMVDQMVIPGIAFLAPVNLKDVNFEKCEKLILETDGSLFGCDSNGEYQRLYKIPLALFNRSLDGTNEFAPGNPKIQLIAPGIYSSERWEIASALSGNRGFFKSGYPILRYQ